MSHLYPGLQLRQCNQSHNDKMHYLREGPWHVSKEHSRCALLRESDTILVLNRRQKEMNSLKREEQSSWPRTPLVHRANVAITQFTSLRESRADTFDHWPFLFSLLRTKKTFWHLSQQATRTGHKQLIVRVTQFWSLSVWPTSFLPSSSAVTLSQWALPSVVLTDLHQWQQWWQWGWTPTKWVVLSLDN